MQGYILTSSRLEKKPLVGLNSQQKGNLNFCIRGSPPWSGMGREGGSGRDRAHTFPVSQSVPTRCIFEIRLSGVKFQREARICVELHGLAKMNFARALCDCYQQQLVDTNPLLSTSVLITKQ